MDSYARVLHILRTVLAPKNSKVVAGVSGAHAHFLSEVARRLVQILLSTSRISFLTTRVPTPRTVEINGVHHNLMSMKKSLIYVDDSPIHGKGLFARKHIGAGELIGVLDGAPTSTDGEHVLWLDE